jgi:hypothetical protein
VQKECPTRKIGNVLHRDTSDTFRIWREVLMSWRERLLWRWSLGEPNFWRAQWAQFGILDETGYKIFKQKAA